MGAAFLPKALKYEHTVWRAVLKRPQGWRPMSKGVAAMSLVSQGISFVAEWVGDCRKVI